MSTVTISPGDLITMDPSDKKVVTFDFEANIADTAALASYVATISAIQQNGATLLTYDNDALVAGNRAVRIRLLATTASRGDRYSVAIRGITNEAPPQEKEYSFDVLIQDH